MNEQLGFRPAWWLPGPHLQTLGARRLRARIHVPLRRERVELPDGDFVDCDFAEPGSSATERAPIVVVLHGLEGSARSGYALETYRLLRELGMTGVGLNFRSCSGEPNRLPRFYHSGDTEDLKFVLAVLGERFPFRPLGAVGFSLGGNVLLKHLGETGATGDSPLEVAAAVSNPFELAAGADWLRRPRGRPYAAHLLRRLRRKLLDRAAILPSTIDVAAGLAARTFREFDDAVTAPLHGFASADDYYERSSSARFLDSIRVPTLLVQSLDDPFLPPEGLPRSRIAGNPCLTPAFTRKGGHLGFVGGPSPRRRVFWAERRAVGFLAARLTRPGRPQAG